MCWNKPFAFLGTLRFKVALWYAALFALSATASFVVIYGYMSRHLLEQADERLRTVTRSIAFEYLTGGKFRRFDREIDPGRIPEAERKAFEAKLPGLTPLFAFERNTAERSYRTLIGHREGRLFELRLESDGSVYSRQLQPERNLPLLLKSVEELTLSETNGSFFLRFTAADGRTLARSDFFPASFTTDFTNGRSFRTEPLDEGNYRVARFHFFDGSRLEIGRSLAPEEEQLGFYLQIFSLALLALLFIGGLCGRLIAGKFIAGVKRVSEAAGDIANGDFSRRVAAGKEGSEINHLVEVFNRMNANTERLLTELRGITDDIAHDLRTPLTRMRGMAELTIGGEPSPEEARELAETIADECNKLIEIINTMLEITRTGSFAEELTTAPLRLDEIFRQCHELFQPTAEDKEIEFALELPPEPVEIRADRVKIQRMTANLVDNALKFTREKGKVTLSLRREGELAVMTVADNGPGISEEDQQHVFDRFFRSDSSRTLTGNGLGLALVHAIVLAHGGDIRVESRLGEGTRFIVAFRTS